LVSFLRSLFFIFCFQFSFLSFVSFCRHFFSEQRMSERELEVSGDDG
jgi:hypothetical protein